MLKTINKRLLAFKWEDISSSFYSENFLHVLNILYIGEASKCNSLTLVKEILTSEIYLGIES